MLTSYWSGWKQYHSLAGAILERLYQFLRTAEKIIRKIRSKTKFAVIKCTMKYFSQS